MSSANDSNLSPTSPSPPRDLWDRGDASERLDDSSLLETLSDPEFDPGRGKSSSFSSDTLPTDHMSSTKSSRRSSTSSSRSDYTMLQRRTLSPSTQSLDPEAPPKEEAPVTWRTLPRKDQLFILMLARLSEPLTQTSLSAYMYYQLKSFDPSLPESTISSQAGLLQGAFSASQFLTAILWGRCADWEGMGRKRVLLVGLAGTAVSAVGFGFSRSFVSAMVFRCIGGALNGNVGVLRTMISETIKEKKYQSRAFLILPMTFNIGVIIGPILGGLLADPVASYPSVFGPGSLLGGKDGVQWMMKWPYALPNLVSAVFLALSALCVIFGLEETLVALRYKPDYGLRLGQWLKRRLFRSSAPVGYARVPNPDDPSLLTPRNSTTTLPLEPTTPDRISSKARKPLRKLPFRRIWTPNVLLTLLAHGLLAVHVSTFQSLWFVFLSTPRATTPPHLPLQFTGGLALPPSRIGLALSILGAIGLTLQLFLYPRLASRLGTVLSYRLVLPLFPLVHVLTPFLALIPSTSPPPAPASGFLVWAGIAGILFLQVLGRTFALPANTILVNNCCPHPSVLGTVHGLGTSVSAAGRTIGPVAWGAFYGWGLRHGSVGAAWWGLGVVAVANVVVGGWVREGSGREIVLEGEENDDDVRGEGRTGS